MSTLTGREYLQQRFISIGVFPGSSSAAFHTCGLLWSSRRAVVERGNKRCILELFPRPLRPHHYLRDSYQSALRRLPPPLPLSFRSAAPLWYSCRCVIEMQRRDRWGLRSSSLSLSPCFPFTSATSFTSVLPLPPLSWCQHRPRCNADPSYVVIKHTATWSEVKLILVGEVGKFFYSPPSC